MVPNQAKLNPTAGDTLSVGGQELTWNLHRSESWHLDLDKALGRRQDHFGALAVSYIHSDRARKVKLLIGMDDFARVYFNGKQVYETWEDRYTLLPSDAEVEVDLKQGENVIVFKVIDRTGPAGACVQIVDTNYQPLVGVTARAKRKAQ